MITTKTNDHDKLIFSMRKIFQIHGFSTNLDVTGKRFSIIGDSGSKYYPDIIAKRGVISIICDARTSGQRGTSKKIDRGVIQFLQAELDDLTQILKRPIGMVVNPYGIIDSARLLADHFGILIIILPMNVVNKINTLDIYEDRNEIENLAKINGIELL